MKYHDVLCTYADDVRTKFHLFTFGKLLAAAARGDHSHGVSCDVKEDNSMKKNDTPSVSVTE